MRKHISVVLLMTSIPVLLWGGSLPLVKECTPTGRSFTIPGYAIKSWKDNWEELTAYFDYPMEIRKIIYTTNAIESLNSGIRKYTKTKTVFPDDQSALKAVYLAVNNVQQKWTMPIQSWGIIINQFIIKFGDRCQI